MSASRIPLVKALLVAGVCQAASAQASLQMVVPAAVGQYGLYSAGDFRMVDGSCQGCATTPAALWYFKSDLVAVPNTAAAGVDGTLRTHEDIRHWVSTRQVKPQGVLPPLVWVGSAAVARGVMSRQGDTLAGDENQRLGFAVVRKIDSNLSYYDAASIDYFAGRPIKARGQLDNEKFVARTLWPQDFALQPDRLVTRALGGDESLASLVRADGGGAASPLTSRLLWKRSGSAADLAGKPVMAFVLNGAQGDDDEAHGGHFAVATGRFGPGGEWDDWLVNNFYNLDSVSEKGIIASTLPMDSYQGDLNSGQSWYRPSYMLVAVFKNERVPRLYQEAIGRVFNHFYRHDFRYNHASANCAGISLETLRSLGWNIPRQGAGSRLKATIALPYMTIKDGSLESGLKAYDYLVAEQTNLYPFRAFTAAGEDLLLRIANGPAAATPFERAMAEDIEALVYVRIPQFPSSRAMGQAPVASLDEYMARTPEDRSKWKIVPVASRPFPTELKDPQAPNEEWSPSSIALAGYVGFFCMLGVGAWRMKRLRSSRRHRN